MRRFRTFTAAGFSMLELIIAVFIVGILASVALPNWGRAVERSKVKDVQSTLSAAFEAERMHRLDDDAYGTLNELFINGYLSDPDAGNANADWNFASSNISATTFTITATRTGGGFNGNTVVVDQNYTSQLVAGYGNRIYNGNHTLRD